MRLPKSITNPGPRTLEQRPWVSVRAWKLVTGVLTALGLSWLVVDIVLKPSKRNIQVLAGLAFLAMMLVAHPFMGLLFTLISVPFPAYTSVGSTSSLLIFAMSALSLVKAKSLNLPSPFFDKRADLALIAFVVFAFLSLYKQPFDNAYEIRRFYLGLTSAVVLYYLVLQLVTDERRFVQMFRLQLFMAVVLGVIANLQAMFPTKTILPAFFSFSKKVAEMEEVRAGYIRAHATFNGYELFAEYCAIMIVLQWIAFRRARTLFEKTFWVAAIGVMALALFRTGTRAGLIILGFGFVYALIVGARAIPRAAVLRVMFVGLGFFYLTLPFTYSHMELLLSRMETLGVDDGSVQSRSHVLEAAPEARDPLPESFLARDHHLRRRRRGGGPDVGHHVGDRVVNLVADRAHHRDLGPGDRARDDLLVERPQVFQRAASSGHDDGVDVSDAVQHPNALGDLGSGEASLDLGGVDEDVEVGKPAMQHAADVPDRGAAGGRHDPEPPGKQGKGLLPLRIEQTFGRELLLQLLEGDLERALPAGLHPLHQDLIAPAALVDGERTPQQHRHTVLGAEAKPPRGAREQHAVDLRLRVLQGEVVVARGRPLSGSRARPRPTRRCSCAR